ncbi:hypothetical protein FDENT_1555 [Fusarium denticulatum]|uniref:Uncharacterized protein n=1 Tax=Fusarium denticulatum TaxID=48507 RepID=A0A8H5XI80_9HYPO|nr:hypothetical protein FDENT_1555 [Fusarium denticulatum]
MSFSNLCKVAPVDAKAPTTINTPVDMANPKCCCHCGCNNVVTFSGGNLSAAYLACEIGFKPILIMLMDMPFPKFDEFTDLFFQWLIRLDALGPQTRAKLSKSQFLGNASAHIRGFSIEEVVD